MGAPSRCFPRTTCASQPGVFGAGAGHRVTPEQTSSTTNDHQLLGPGSAAADCAHQQSIRWGPETSDSRRDSDAIEGKN